MGLKRTGKIPCVAIVGGLIAVGVGLLIGLVVAIALITVLWGRISW